MTDGHQNFTRGESPECYLFVLAISERKVNALIVWLLHSEQDPVTPCPCITASRMPFPVLLPLCSSAK
jgi:hypothetical protein